MIALFNDKTFESYTEIDEETLNKGLQDGSITIEQKFKEHHNVPANQKRAAKSAKEIYEEMLAEGKDVVIHNGIYCKHIYNTFEAINPISAIDDWDEYEDVYVKNN